MKVTLDASRPLRKVIFEMPKPLGLFPCYYHDVVRTEQLLILIYNHDFPQQHVWFPNPPDPPKMDEEGNLVEEKPVEFALLVYDEEGNKDTGFICLATHGRFTYQNLEFCQLAIVREKSYKEVPNGVPQQS